MTKSTGSREQTLDEILQTIGVEGVEDKRVVGRAGAKAAIRAAIDRADGKTVEEVKRNLIKELGL